MFDLEALVKENISAPELKLESAKKAQDMSVKERKRVIASCLEEMSKCESIMEEIMERNPDGSCDADDAEAYMNAGILFGRYRSVQAGMMFPDAVIKEMQSDFQRQLEMFCEEQYGI